MVVVVGGDHESVVARHLVDDRGHGERGTSDEFCWTKRAAKDESFNFLKLDVLGFNDLIDI